MSNQNSPNKYPSYKIGDYISIGKSTERYRITNIRRALNMPEFGSISQISNEIEIDVVNDSNIRTTIRINDVGGYHKEKHKKTMQELERESESIVKNILGE